MSGERQLQIERICQSALDLEGAARRTYLDSACEGDPALRRDVESLLAYEDAAETFIQAPAVEHVARALAKSATLTSGDRIGPYEVIAVLGSGGMGEVYRARDTKLRRDVAIKVLPQLFLSDPTRRARFEGEARTLAALNHPHIAAIYGTDESNGVPALVLELVEGDTLEGVLARSPRRRLPPQKALPIARQIAEALESAHDKGIVHLDLKPSNVTVTADGRVKVLDFGLATALGDHDGDDGDAPPTAGASHGLIVGSPAYMSPEQAQGQPTDKRTDVWAFGCVLFEMLSGKRAFTGDTASTTVDQVLTADPDWTALPEPLAPPITRLLRRCLQKDRRQRLADIADARLEIDDALSTPDGSASRRVAPRWRERVAWVTAAICFAGALTLAYFWRTPETPPRVVRFSIDVAGMAPADAFFMTLSPDGTRIAYPALTPSGRIGLWVRPLDSLTAQFLTGTEGALQNDWSPDGRFILFTVNQRLKKIEATGGTPQTLAATTGEVRRTAWSHKGVILQADGPTIRRIADTGAASTEVTALDALLAETYHSTPWFLPDGRHFLYTAWSSNPEHKAVYVASLDSRERTRLMPAESKAIYSPPGFILFRRGGQLMARPFDARRLTFTGDAQLIAETVRFNPELGQTAFSVSSEGTLAYVTDAPTDLSLVWMDRQGRRLEVPTALAGAVNPTLNADARQVAFHVGATPDIWTYDFDRNQTARLTTDPAADRFPLFSRDGSRLLFSSDRENPGRSGLYEKSSDGAVRERNILAPEPGSVMIPRDWDRNGTHLVFETGPGWGALRDIWVLPIVPGQQPYRYVATTADERHPSLSPDGRWLAYTSNESNTYQVIVQAFPDPTRRFTVASGRFPRWKRDGGELYYVDPDGWLVAAAVRTAPTFQVLRTDRLFNAPFVPAMTDLSIPYDVTRDGRRFLMSTPSSVLPGSQKTTINIVVGWPSLLRQ
jgi:serine/threonine protein kinase/Tol biopolymer transport system component